VKPTQLISEGVTPRAARTRPSGVASLAKCERKESSNICAHDAPGPP
jgi:hypothetical protein